MQVGRPKHINMYIRVCKNKISLFSKNVPFETDSWLLNFALNSRNLQKKERKLNVNRYYIYFSFGPANNGYLLFECPYCSLVWPYSRVYTSASSLSLSYIFANVSLIVREKKKETKKKKNTETRNCPKNWMNCLFYFYCYWTLYLLQWACISLLIFHSHQHNLFMYIWVRMRAEATVEVNTLINFIRNVFSYETRMSTWMNENYSQIKYPLVCVHCNRRCNFSPFIKHKWAVLLFVTRPNPNPTRKHAKCKSLK